MLQEDMVNISKLLQWIYEQLDAYAAGAQTISLPPTSLLNVSYEYRPINGGVAMWFLSSMRMLQGLISLAS